MRVKLYASNAMSRDYSKVSCRAELQFVQDNWSLLTELYPKSHVITRNTVFPPERFMNNASMALSIALTLFPNYYLKSFNDQASIIDACDRIQAFLGQRSVGGGRLLLSLSTNQCCSKYGQ